MPKENELKLMQDAESCNEEADKKVKEALSKQAVRSAVDSTNMCISWKSCGWTFVKHW